MAMRDLRRIARAICEAKCLRAEVCGDPCIDPETSKNARCRATDDQLLLDWRSTAADCVIKAIQHGDA
jgi:hypothetical protein